MGKSSGKWPGKSRIQISQEESGQSPQPVYRQAPGEDHLPGVPYKKGDFIGQKYEVHELLGKGGFGVVYLVYSHETKDVYALKTFRDEYLRDEKTRQRFHQEASLWINLERHPNLVRAFYVDEIAGRLYIATEYVAPDQQGLNSLEGYLQRRPPDLAQSLRWAIQFCHGMEYACSKGVRTHRDIKPANILISQGKTVKIADFGLAGVLGTAEAISGIKLNIVDGSIGLCGQTLEGEGFGTPTYMPPEQFTYAAECDERSDIYAFGIVLYQMGTGGKLPFLAPWPKNNSEEEMRRFWREMHRLHNESPVPQLDSPLFPIIQRCLEKQPGKRYRNFKELRLELEPLLRHETGEVVRPPGLEDLAVWEWVNKGASLYRLGRPEEALHCFNQALELEPHHIIACYNKGTSLDKLGRSKEALHCFDQVLELEPRLADAWFNKGISLDKLGFPEEEALRCYNQALELNPSHADAWYNKGVCLDNLGYPDEALRCYDQVLILDPSDAMAWYNKGVKFGKLGCYEEALSCYDQALELAPRSVNAWYNKGNSLYALSRYEEAVRCYDQVLILDPSDAKAWYNKGVCLDKLGHREEAVHCYDCYNQALELNERDADV